MLVKTLLKFLPRDLTANEWLIICSDNNFKADDKPFTELKISPFY